MFESMEYAIELQEKVKTLESQLIATRAEIERLRLGLEKISGRFIYKVGKGNRCFCSEDKYEKCSHLVAKEALTQSGGEKEGK